MMSLRRHTGSIKYTRTFGDLSEIGARVSVRRHERQINGPIIFSPSSVTLHYKEVYCIVYRGVKTLDNNIIETTLLLCCFLLLPYHFVYHHAR